MGCPGRLALSLLIPSLVRLKMETLARYHDITTTIQGEKNYPLSPCTYAWAFFNSTIVHSQEPSNTQIIFLFKTIIKVGKAQTLYREMDLCLYHYRMLKIT